MYQHEFETTVLAALADLKVEQAETKVEVRNIVARLDRLNGSVSRHERELRDQELRLASRQSDCPLVDAVKVQVRPLEDFVTAARAAEKTSKTWLDRLWPFIWAAAGMIGSIVLEHAAELLKHVK